MMDEEEDGAIQRSSSMGPYPFRGVSRGYFSPHTCELVKETPEAGEEDEAYDGELGGEEEEEDEDGDLPVERSLLRGFCCSSLNEGRFLQAQSQVHQQSHQQPSWCQGSMSFLPDQCRAFSDAEDVPGDTADGDCSMEEDRIFSPHFHNPYLHLDVHHGEVQAHLVEKGISFEAGESRDCDLPLGFASLSPGVVEDMVTYFSLVFLLCLQTRAVILLTSRRQTWMWIWR